jgi:hypothetical protein
VNAELRPIEKPHCILLYALAPEELSPGEANRVFNQLIADPGLPLVVFHDHFINPPGGVAIFYAHSRKARQALNHLDELEGWATALHGLVYSATPAGFDEQIAFTLRAYRGLDWDRLREEGGRPSYGRAQGAATSAPDEGD